MPTSFLVLNIFVYFFLITINSSAKECMAPGILAPIAKVLTEWFVKGFTNNKVSKCIERDALIYGDCFAGFFGEGVPMCHFEFVSEPAEILSQCTAALNNFYTIVGSSTKYSITQILTVVENQMNVEKLRISIICNNLEEYLIRRMTASEGGHFVKSKMAKYCKRNVDVCKEVDKFLDNKAKYLDTKYRYIAPSTLSNDFDDDFDKLNFNDSTAIIFNVVGSIKSDYRFNTDNKNWAIQVFAPCLLQFFETMSASLG